MGNPEQPVTSKYIDVDFTPEYAFGFGLTYTTLGVFERTRVIAWCSRAGSRSVSAEVANRGSREGAETVQR